MRPVAWMWKQHGWAITAHGKHRAIKTSVDVSRPPNSTIESLDFIGLWPLYARAQEIAGINKLPHFKPFDDADLITVEEFFSEGGMQCFTGDDGTGYFACAHGISDVSCWNDAPNWATHIAWYGK